MRCLLVSEKEERRKKDTTWKKDRKIGRNTFSTREGGVCFPESAFDRRERVLVLAAL
jgi:hypothetical protein